mmetsp:Transcript_106748/g.307048  ORF Transcript_106748/g.307048 Transcript_106748/m.307048 type:complete len:279 (-) Transcript_106748:444-1280(-)
MLQEGRRLRDVQGELWRQQGMELREARPEGLPTVHVAEPEASRRGHPHIRTRPLQGHRPRQVLSEAGPARLPRRRLPPLGLGRAGLEVQGTPRRDPFRGDLHGRAGLPVVRLLLADGAAVEGVHRLDGGRQRLLGPHVRLVRPDVLEAQGRLGRPERALHRPGLEERLRERRGVGQLLQRLQPGPGLRRIPLPRDPQPARHMVREVGGEAWHRAPARHVLADVDHPRGDAHRDSPRDVEGHRRGHRPLQDLRRPYVQVVRRHGHGIHDVQPLRLLQGQ